MTAILLAYGALVCLVNAVFRAMLLRQGCGEEWAMAGEEGESDYRLQRGHRQLIFPYYPLAGLLSASGFVLLAHFLLPGVKVSLSAIPAALGGLFLAVVISARIGVVLNDLRACLRIGSRALRRLPHLVLWQKNKLYLIYDLLSCFGFAAAATCIFVLWSLTNVWTTSAVTVMAFLALIMRIVLRNIKALGRKRRVETLLGRLSCDPKVAEQRDAKVTRELIQALDDVNEDDYCSDRECDAKMSTAFSAAECLRYLAPPEAAPALVRFLKTGTVMKSAGDALIRIGEPAVGALAAHLHEFGWQHTAQPIEILGAIGGAAAKQVLTDLTNDQAIAARYRSKAASELMGLENRVCTRAKAPFVPVESTEKEQNEESIRRRIWEMVGPTSILLYGDADIVRLGARAVPALIDIFRNPFDQYGTANLALVAAALSQFGMQGDPAARSFLHAIAKREVPVAGPYGRRALAIAEEFTRPKWRRMVPWL